ncbi:MAG: orotate phosphoribosyltransferase [Bacillota bacterium]
MKTQQQWLDRLVELGVLRQGHFLLTSGRHSDRFMLLSQLFQYPDACQEFADALAAKLPWQNIDVVIGPAMGGVILAYEVAKALKGPRAIYAEKTDGPEMALKRGFMLRPGERVVVVEDAISTGGSINKVIQLVRQSEAELVGAAALVDRTGGQIDLGIPFVSLISLTVESYASDSCPLCQAGLPLIKPKS